MTDFGKCACGQPRTNSTNARCRECRAKYMRNWRATKAPLPVAELSVDAALRIRSRATARKAKQRGSLIQQPCACCGNPDTQMHHPDYEQPRVVVWLCLKHHTHWHGFLRASTEELFEQWMWAQRAAHFDTSPSALLSNPSLLKAAGVSKRFIAALKKQQADAAANPGAVPS